MGILNLPAEIRIRIYENVPDLASGRFETIARNVCLTPAICRVSHGIRAETLPIYAQNARFIIQIERSNVHDKTVAAWVEAMDQSMMASVRHIQLSREWQIHPLPGHVGFYVRLMRESDAWQCKTGTYPIAKDMRGMRLESVELLQQVIRMNLLRALSVRENEGLVKADIEFVLNTMEIVADHPISAFDTEQSESGRKRRRDVWAEMESKLLRAELRNDVEGEKLQGSTSFYTPY